MYGVPRVALDTLAGLTKSRRWDADRAAWIVPAQWAAALAGWARSRGRVVEVTREAG